MLDDGAVLNETIDLQAARIRDLEATVARLREALEPLAQDGCANPNDNDGHCGYCSPCLAIEALSEERE